MTKNIINQELVNKLSSIIKAYPIYSYCLDSYEEEKAAIEMQGVLDQSFLHTCEEYGYNVEVSFCCVLAELLAKGKFASAEELTTEYIEKCLINDFNVVLFLKSYDFRGINELITNDNRNRLKMIDLVECYCFPKRMEGKAQKTVVKKNEKLEREFVEAATRMGLKATTADLKNLAEICKTPGYNYNTIKECVEAFIAYNGCRTEKEEVTMKKANVQIGTENNKAAVKGKGKNRTLIELVRGYGFPQHIHNCKLKKELEKVNSTLERKFVEAARNMGIEASTSDLKILAENCKVNHKYNTIEEGVEAFINSKGSRAEKEDKVMKAAAVAKEESTMKKAAVNEAVKKEESTMTRLQEVLMNGTRTDRMVQILEFCDNVTNKRDDRYVDKDTLAQFLYDSDIIGRKLPDNEVKRTKREVLIDVLRTAVNNLIKAGIITPIKTVSFEQLEELMGINEAEKKEVQTMNNENTNIPVPVVVNSTPVAPIPINVGDACVQDVIYPDLNPEMAAPVKPAPVKTAPIATPVAVPVTTPVKENNMEQYWTKEIATAILVGSTSGALKDDRRKGAGIINHMATNKCHDFISEHMLTSVIAEVLTGKTLKHWDKVQKKMVDSVYKQVEIDTIKFVRGKFIEKYLYQKKGDTKGYRLRSDILQWCYKTYGIKTISFGVWDAINNKWQAIYDLTGNTLVVRGTNTVYDIHGEDFRKLEWNNVVFIS